MITKLLTELRSLSPSWRHIVCISAQSLLDMWWSPQGNGVNRRALYILTPAIEIYISPLIKLRPQNLYSEAKLSFLYTLWALPAIWLWSTSTSWSRGNKLNFFHLAQLLPWAPYCHSGWRFGQTQYRPSTIFIFISCRWSIGWFLHSETWWYTTG